MRLKAAGKSHQKSVLRFGLERRVQLIGKVELIIFVDLESEIKCSLIDLS